MSGPPIADLDLDRFAALAGRAADAARSIVRPLFRTSLAAQSKADESPVTIADRQVEQAITTIIRAACPEHDLIGEEQGEVSTGSRLRWVIDPIDGTRAFITGRPTFGTLIALLDDETPILGLIDQPISGERWVGIKHRKTVFSGPYAGTVGTRACRALSTAEMSCTAPDMQFGSAIPRWLQLANSVRRVSWGGDCYAYGLLALGQIDIVAEASLQLWDWAALQPVVEGAGGRLTDWEGRPLHVSGSGEALAVGDPALLQEAVDMLRDKQKARSEA